MHPSNFLTRMATTLLQSDLPGLNLIHRGKVRDVSSTHLFRCDELLNERDAVLLRFRVQRIRVRLDELALLHQRAAQGTENSCSGGSHEVLDQRIKLRLYMMLLR